MQELWNRIREGKHTALVGLTVGEPPPSTGLYLVRVSCDVPPTTLGPLLEARRKVERILDGSPLLDQARDRVVAGLRRHLLGDLPALAAEGSLVETYNRLARHSDRPVGLLFDALDAADEATLSTLRQILRRPGWLRLPLVLVLRREPTGEAAALLESLRAAAGPESILRAPEAEAPAAAKAESPEPPLPALPAEVLRVLRAGAIIGSGFEAHVVAALLGADPLAVLDALQRAADAGVPIEDRGEGRFHLPEAMIAGLRASLLPSFALALHRRLAAVLGEEPEAERRPEPQQEPASLRQEPPHGEPPPQKEPLPDEEPLRDEPLHDATLREEPVIASAPSPEPEAMPEPEATPEPEAMPEPQAAPEPPPIVHKPFAERPETARRSPPPLEVPSPPRAPLRETHRDPARAAGHLEAAGEVEAGAERYFAAARQAAAAAAYPQAVAHGKKALGLLDSLPPSPRRRRLRLAILVELGRLQWQAAGPDASYTLAGALRAAETARASLDSGDPPQMQAEIAALIAGICHDLGDVRSLERGLEELTRASRLLLGAGDAPSASRLLNDQASLYLRAGDPVRAAHLLEESRRVFEQRSAIEPLAMVEMAETDHLMASIPLHVPARPGREADALSAGLDHALAAERAYRKLGAPRELGRVWETMGRLELRRGRVQRAAERLSAAMQVQESIGDLFGLARSTAALSDLCAGTGRLGEALGLLGDSVAFNVEKGSPIGLAYNRRALSSLGRKTTPIPELRELCDEVEARLAAGEAALGRLPLPGERDAA